MIARATAAVVVLELLITFPMILQLCFGLLTAIANC